MSLPIAVGLLAMVYPVLAVEYQMMPLSRSQGRHQRTRSRSTSTMISPVRYSGRLLLPDLPARACR